MHSLQILLLEMINDNSDNSDNSCHLYIEHLLYVSLYITLEALYICYGFFFHSHSIPKKNIILMPTSQMRKQRLGVSKPPPQP